MRTMMWGRSLALSICFSIAMPHYVVGQAQTYQSPDGEIFDGPDDACTAMLIRIDVGDPMDGAGEEFFLDMCGKSELKWCEIAIGKLRRLSEKGDARAGRLAKGIHCTG